MDPRPAITNELVGPPQRDGDLQTFARHTGFLSLLASNEPGGFGGSTSVPILVADDFGIVPIAEKGVDILSAEPPEHQSSEVNGKKTSTSSSQLIALPLYGSLLSYGATTR